MNQRKMKLRIAKLVIGYADHPLMNTKYLQSAIDFVFLDRNSIAVKCRYAALRIAISKAPDGQGWETTLNGAITLWKFVNRVDGVTEQDSAIPEFTILIGSLRGRLPPS